MLRWLTSNRLGTYLFTRLHGEEVGRDEFGNVYYRRKGAPGEWRRERRWVVYGGDGEIEASMVPPGWNAWLHHNREESPAQEPLKVRSWEQEHRPNPSGTLEAYTPPGLEPRGGRRARATGDYEAWRPGGG